MPTQRYDYNYQSLVNSFNSEVLSVSGSTISQTTLYTTLQVFSGTSSFNLFAPSYTGGFRKIINLYAGIGFAEVITNRGTFYLNNNTPSIELVWNGSIWVSVYANTPSMFPTAQIAQLIGTGFTTVSGLASAISLESNTVALGSPGDNGVGATWVFTRNIFGWTQQGAKLIGTGFSAAGQGYSLALDGIGNTLAIGGRTDNTNVGATWVFTRSGGVWTQQGPKLVGTGYSGSSTQGSSVSLSGDSNTLIIGGPGDNGIGATWVFTRNQGGTVWTQLGNKLVGTGYSGASNQGVYVKCSANSATVAVGATTDAVNVGATWIFTKNAAGNWVQQGAKLIGTGFSAAGQGIVSLSADGTTVASGGKTDFNSVGAVWVFSRNAAGTWVQQGTKLVGTGYSAATQGSSTALTLDGNTLISNGNTDNTNVGASWVFTRGNGVWTQQNAKLVGTGGTSISNCNLSGNGNTLVSTISTASGPSLLIFD